jgi:hypothetical protein
LNLEGIFVALIFPSFWIESWSLNCGTPDTKTMRCSIVFPIFGLVHAVVAPAIGVGNLKTSSPPASTIEVIEPFFEGKAGVQ